MFTTLSEAIAAYDDMLDDVYLWSVISGIHFAPSRILREVDPIAYQVGFHDWLDGEGVDSDDLEDDAGLP